MPSHWDREAVLNNTIATSFEEQTGLGDPRHDRIHGDNLVPGVSSTIAMTGDSNDIEVEITARQKMISAMSGSLLTSLLGKLP
jgi:solute carrier family 25 protein 39/40